MRITFVIRGEKKTTYENITVLFSFSNSVFAHSPKTLPSFFLGIEYSSIKYMCNKSCDLSGAGSFIFIYCHTWFIMYFYYLVFNTQFKSLILYVYFEYHSIRLVLYTIKQCILCTRFIYLNVIFARYIVQLYITLNNPLLTYISVQESSMLF